MASDLSADPFHESSPARGSRRLTLLGGDFHFDSDCEALLRLVDEAFGGLPAHRLPGNRPRFQVSLRRLPPVRNGRAPAPVALSGAAGLLGAVTPGSSAVLIDPAGRGALIIVPDAQLADPYVVRYECIEFAVYTLASRALGLLALHAACIGRHGRGLLAVGDSGAGKTTLALHALFAGYEVLAEDAVFLAPDGLRATGVPNFVHVRSDSLRFLPPAARRQVRRAPSIRRRSGVRKFELDLRRPPFLVARRPLALQALVLLSPRSATGRHPLLAPVSTAEAERRFVHTQPYAVCQPGWPRVRRQLASLPAFELRRGAHPDDALPLLDQLLRRR